MHQHVWVMITVCPVTVLPNRDGQPVVLVDPEKQQEAERKAQFGCARCDEALDTHYLVDCTGREQS